MSLAQRTSKRLLTISDDMIKEDSMVKRTAGLLREIESDNACK